ncbi:MAG TPA: PEGA domain-containing protein [Candidatus Binataceae bacterium]|nr:PEGA domain-containing protein [Candidatus Binataceae bacterium]
MRLIRIVWVFALAAISVGICSCALLFQGTTENINIQSDPPGAAVTLNSGEKGVTPFSVTVPRDEDLQLHFDKPGYQSVNLTDNSRVEGIIALDAIPFLIPWAIDAAAGAGYEHQQSSVTAHLAPESGTTAGDSGKARSQVSSPSR